MNDLLLIVALVTMVQAGKAVGTATGFFYLKNERLYFVTNRHVVVDETKGLKADELVVRLHSNPNDLSKNVERRIPLYRGSQPTWHVHKNYPRVPIDIAVIEMETQVVNSVVVKALNRSNSIPDKFIINPGEDVMVIGFPRGLSDSVHNLPLVRNALISSAYGVDFEASPSFLIDANLHPGMNGSPVLTKPKNIWPDRDGNTNMLTGSPTYFLGVFSATLSVRISGNPEALGLGQVWYAKLIEEIIDSIGPEA